MGAEPDGQDENEKDYRGGGGKALAKGGGDRARRFAKALGIDKIAEDLCAVSVADEDEE